MEEYEGQVVKTHLFGLGLWETTFPMLAGLYYHGAV